MGLTQVQFSEKIGTTQNVYTRYETGKLDLPDHIKNSLHHLGVNLNWLITGAGSMYQDLQPVDASILVETVSIPIVGEIAAGHPAESFYEEPYLRHDIPTRFLTYPPPHHIFMVSGNSMAPEVKPGDLVVCSQDWRDVDINGKIMVFRTDEGITLKKLVDDYRHKTTLLVPLNSSYEPTIYMEDDPDIVMIGILDLCIRRYNR